MSDPNARECPNCKHIMEYYPPEHDVGLLEGWMCGHCEHKIFGNADEGLVLSWREIKSAVICSDTGMLVPNTVTVTFPELKLERQLSPSEMLTWTIPR
jgi:hypothetical protein